MTFLTNILRQLVLGPAYFTHLVLIKKSKHWSKKNVLDYKNDNKALKCYNTKVDITRSSEEFLKRSPLLPLRKVRTGGTTGEPFLFYQDIFISRQKERAYLFDIWGRIGYKKFDYRIVVRGNMPSHDKKYSFLENALVLSQNFFVEENKKELGVLFRKKSFFLHVYPSTLFFLIDFWGIDIFKTFPINGVFAGSEAFPISQMKWFKQNFNIQIAHWYGHSEYAILARYCNTCSEFHFYPTYGRAEVFQEKQTDLILANSFNSYGTIFKDYFTGDYAEKSTQTCEIDNFFKLKSIKGRIQEFIFDKELNRRAFGPYLFGIHNEFWDFIVWIQFIQEVKGRLEVKYVKSSNFDKTRFLEIIEQRFELFELEFNDVDYIEKTKNGKHKSLIQLVK
jgi:phenylacetate-CoA ligase